MSKKTIDESLQKLNDELTRARSEGRKRAVKNIQKIIDRLKKMKN